MRGEPSQAQTFAYAPEFMALEVAGHRLRPRKEPRPQAVVVMVVKEGGPRGDQPCL